MKKMLLLLCLTWSVSAQDFVPFLWDNNSGTGNGLLNNLAAFWRFEETAGNVSDSSGNGRTLIESGSNPNGTGIVGNDRFYAFGSGTSDYFSVASDSALTFGSNPFTITAWAFLSPHGVTPNDLTILCKGDYGSGSLSWWLVFDAGVLDDFMRFIFTSDGTYTFPDATKELNITYSGGLSVAGWQLFVVRWDGSTLHMSATYSTDSAVSADVTKAFAGPFFNNSGSPVVIAANLGSALHHMDGDMDEIGIWNRYLSDCEVAWLFTAKAGSFTYPSFDPFTCVSP